MEPRKSRICAEVDTLARDLYAVSEYLYHNPEIGYQEFKACEFLSRFMNVGILGKSAIKDGRFLMFVLIIPLFQYSIISSRRRY